VPGTSPRRGKLYLFLKKRQQLFMRFFDFFGEFAKKPDLSTIFSQNIFQFFGIRYT
jgi:hypothetical protein